MGSISVSPESALVFDLRLVGIARSIRVESRSRLTLPVSYCGPVRAVATRMPMFIDLAATCASLQLFQIKIVSVADAVAFVFYAHRRFGSRLTQAAERQKRRIGGVVVVMVRILASGCMIA